MKKYNVFKVLFIALLVAIVASFLIPQSQIGYEGIETGNINPITFVDSISNVLTSFSVFVSSFMYILAIGILYYVLKKSEKYDEVINNTAAKFKNNKKVYLIVSILTFGLLTSILGDVMPMLIFVPAFIDIAKKLGYDSKQAILSTVGAIILGSANSLYTNYTNQILSTTVTTNIIFKVVMLLVTLAILLLFIVILAKPEEVKLEKKKVKKALPISIAFDAILLLVIMGMTPWNKYFGFEGFTNFHNSIVNFKVAKVSLFNAIIGTTTAPFGDWTLYHLTVVILVASVVLAIIYKFKIDEFLESITQGIRKALPYAMILVLANTILVGVYNSGFYTSVINTVSKLSDKVVATFTSSALSAFVYPDYTYASQFTLSTLATVISKTRMYAVIALIFQLIYSLMLLISPTSILLLISLRYEEVSYKDWVKYIYKFFLVLLIIFFVVIIIVGFKFVKPISYVILGVLVVILVLFILLGKNKKQGKKEVIKKKRK